jgi:hypothetical protein
MLFFDLQNGLIFAGLNFFSMFLAWGIPKIIYKCLYIPQEVLEKKLKRKIETILADNNRGYFSICGYDIKKINDT